MVIPLARQRRPNSPRWHGDRCPGTPLFAHFHTPWHLGPNTWPFFFFSLAGGILRQLGVGELFWWLWNTDGPGRASSDAGIMPQMSLEACFGCSYFHGASLFGSALLAHARAHTHTHTHTAAIRPWTLAVRRQAAGRREPLFTPGRSVLAERTRQRWLRHGAAMGLTMDT